LLGEAKWEAPAQTELRPTCVPMWHRQKYLEIGRKQ
jgi:hypothetical protein